MYIECGCVKSVRNGEVDKGEILKGLMYVMINIETLSVGGYSISL